jgi:hypothetical protein
MEELLAFSRALWRLGDSVSQLLLVAAAIAAGAGLVISPHLRGVAFATAAGLAALHLLQ